MVRALREVEDSDFPMDDGELEASDLDDDTDAPVTSEDPDRLYEDEAVSEAVGRIVAKHGAMNWEIGDEARKLRTVYGHGAVTRFARDLILAGIDTSEESVRTYALVARKYPRNTDRSAFVYWSLHSYVSKRGDRLEWIRRAEERQWTLSQLKAEVQRADLEEKIAQEKERGEPITRYSRTGGILGARSREPDPDPDPDPEPEPEPDPAVIRDWETFYQAFRDFEYRHLARKANAALMRARRMEQLERVKDFVDEVLYPDAYGPRF